MKQVNVFHKGMVMDIDPTLIQQDSWTFPTMGARIVNLQGKGYVCQNLDGTNELFSLGDNMVPIGGTEFNSILYIFSAKTDDPGVIEVGSYPSPRSWTNGSSGLENNYKPLKILGDLDDRQNMRTSLFNGTVLNRMEVIARESYDNSVDLFFADGVNPLRTINSGFAQDGTINNRMVSPEDFDSIVNVIQATSNKPKFQYGSIETGGSLLNGNYFAFVRYVTESFNSTEFISHSFAYAVYTDTLEHGNNEGGPSSETTTKQIKLKLTNIDTSYTYVEFALIRYFGDNAPIQYESLLYNNLFPITGEEMEVALSDSDRIVPFPFEEIIKPRNRDIVPKSITYLDNTLWGANWREKDRFHNVLVEYAKRVIIFPKINEIGDDPFVFKPSDTYDNPEYIHDYVGYFRGEIYAFSLVYNFTDGDITDGYPTAGRDDFNNTTADEEISYSDYTGTGTVGYNTDGIYRTPRADLLNDSSSDVWQLLKTGKRRLLYLKFDFTEANRWLNEDTTEKEKEFFKKNISSLNIARAERKENIITQGLSMGLVIPEGEQNNILWEVAKDTNAANVEGSIRHVESVNISNRFFIYGRGTAGEAFETEFAEGWKYPFMYGLIPLWRQERKTSVIKHHHTASYSARGTYVRNEYGVYSPDYIFNKSNNIDNVNYIQRVGKTVSRSGSNMTSRFNSFLSNFVHNDVYPLYFYSLESIDTPDGDGLIQELKSKVTRVDETNTPDSGRGGGFDNKCIGSSGDFENESGKYYLRELELSSSIGLKISNRQLWSLPYLAVETKDYNDGYITVHDLSVSQTAGNFINLDIVNLLQLDPNDIDFLTWYDKQFLKYKITSGDIEVALSDDDIVIQNVYNLWRGDCFLQRTALKIQSWKDSSCKTDVDGSRVVSTSLDGNDPGKYGWDWATDMPGDQRVKYAHGITLSIVTENKYNTNLRYKNRFGQNSYFGSGDVWLTWCIGATTAEQRESLLLNTGNSKTVVDKEIPIYPYLSPYNGTKHPTRIRFSNKYTPGSFLDANRQFEASHYKDFDYAFGEITAVRNHNGMLLSIQESIINRHYINEKAMQVSADSQSLILGSSPEYLQDNTFTVGEFGSRHQHSIYKTENGIYGVDFDRNVIWKTGYREAGSSMIYSAEDISLSKSCRSWIERLYQEFNPSGNPLVKLKDTPANLEGILTGYDRLNREVLFTFLTWLVSDITDYDRIKVIPINLNTHINLPYVKNYVVSYQGSIYGSNVANNTIPPYSTANWEMFSLDNAREFTVDSYNDGEWVYGEYNNEMYVVRVIAKGGPVASLTIDDLFKSTTISLDGGPKSIAIYNYIKVTFVYEKKNFKTLVFSEKNDAFIGEHPFTPVWYGLLDNNFYSVKDSNTVHIHNQSDKIQSFYGEIKPFMITFVAQGLSGESNASIFMKYFTALEIEINHVILKEIVYKTDLQEGIYVYSENSDEFWKDAEYHENKMRLPVFVQTSPDTEWENGEDEYYESSDMKGTYMLITLVYHPEEAEKITLRNAITNFNISQS